MNHPLSKSRACRPWAVRTVVVRLSRKLTATYRIRTGRLLSRLLTAMLSGLSTLATALPEGASLVAGQATVSTPSANAMVVTQGSDKAILNWQAFNIGAGQSVQFVQPNATSAALNRVVGANPSSIYGSLSANGQVFLINPAGVMFAPGAQVNVGALVASTLSISNDDFVAGRYIFSNNGSAGTVTNQGSINAARGGYVLLAAPSVSNTGAINADGGSVGLAAGSRVSIDTSGVGLVSFSVDAAAANAVASNSGIITAGGGQVAVLASALGDAMATVVNQTGVIRATSATERNGMIVLSGGRSGVVHVAGTLDASGTGAGQSGGTVQVLGDKVLLATGAHIDVSGQAGGGIVLVGGDYQGGNSAVQNATRTHVAAGSIIRADAIDQGNGGKVVVWADGDTRSAGGITARGGSNSGNGGFVEVSGKQYLDTRGTIDVTAPQGVGGNVLFDPQDIILSTAVSSPSVVTNQAVNTPDLAFATAPDPGTYTVQISTVTGFNELFLQATRDIAINNPLTMAANGSVRLEANNNITVGALATIGVTGTGAINLKADADSSGAGTLSLAAGLSAQAGGIILSGASVTSTAAGTVNTTGAANGDGGAVSITGTGVVNLAGAITTSGGTAAANSTGRSAGTVSITGAGVTAAAITASGSAGVGAGTSQTGGNGAAISITSTNGVTQTGAITASGGAGSTTGGAGGNAGSITVSNTVAGAISLGTLAAQTGAAVGSGAGGAAGSISVSNAAGNLTTGTLTTTGGINGNGGNITVAAASGTVVTGNIASSGGTANGTTNGRNAGTVSISGAALALGASTITANGTVGSTLGAGGNGGAVTISSTGAITSSGAISAIGGNGVGANQAGGNGAAVSVSSTGGNVTAGSITTSGGNAVAGVASGGNAGTITLDAAGGTPSITLAGNLS
ncbi:MAG: filamentous hemagglutinin N-terminal domain-containing protein, partial [Polaromonas sp.]|nr:filamentous hemagglutinin N-terminal domain-containing protein [Polaromonas sp.]MDP3751058.1 filamentous hemagglutinin N-terminal domain-containing protein [Polaromonas sp.]